MLSVTGELFHCVLLSVKHDQNHLETQWGYLSLFLLDRHMECGIVYDSTFVYYNNFKFYSLSVCVCVCVWRRADGAC